MIDREKVINGLECCFGSIGKACPMECPYRVECLMQDDEYNMYSVMHDALKLLKSQPEQKHGHWVPIKTPTGVGSFGVNEMTVQSVRCSACDAEEDVSSSVYDYCPWCGAKMDEEVKQDADGA